MGIVPGPPRVLLCGAVRTICHSRTGSCVQRRRLCWWLRFHLCRGRGRVQRLCVLQVAVLLGGVARQRGRHLHQHLLPLLLLQRR